MLGVSAVAAAREGYAELTRVLATGREAFPRYERRAGAGRRPTENLLLRRGVADIQPDRVGQIHLDGVSTGMTLGDLILVSDGDVRA